MDLLVSFEMPEAELDLRLRPSFGLRLGTPFRHRREVLVVGLHLAPQRDWTLELRVLSD